MEVSENSVNREMSSLDSNGQNANNFANNTRDSNNVVSNVSSTECEREMLVDSESNAQIITDCKSNVQTKMINEVSESIAASTREAQTTETQNSSDQSETEGSNIVVENNLNLLENVKNSVGGSREQSANPENTGSIGEIPCIVINTGEILASNSETLLTNTEAMNRTNPGKCTSENGILLSNTNNTTVSCNGIVEQFMNQEKIDVLKEKDGSITKETSGISSSNNVEAMITDDQLENNEMSTEETVKENMTIPDNNCKNTLTCNSDTEQSINKGKINDVEETRGNSDDPVEHIEPMVTDDPPEKEKVINESRRDVENTDTRNDVEGIRNANVVEAMNKNQSWKTDKVYQKDLRSLKLLCEYGSDSDEDKNEGEDGMKEDVVNSNKSVTASVPAVNPCPAVHQEYREPEVVSVSDSEDESDSSDETSSTSSATSSSSSDESDESEIECVVVEKVAKEIPKTKGELGLEDLPPIEDLHITVPESECVEIGKVLSIVDSLVVVQSIKGCPALDLDSVLFCDHGKNALGEVFDVFGKVGEACYCVRFNSKDHAIEKGVEVGMPVYYAPRSEYSRYVFLADLTKMKGSDASWAHNNEPPPKFLDYSDDEQERRAKKGNKPPVRNVEREETQPQAKRFNRRGPNRGGMHAAPTSPRSNRPWATPFNRYHSDVSTAPPPPASSPGPKPLIRPSSFRNSDPPPSYNRDNDGSFGNSSHSNRPNFQPLMQPSFFRNTGPPQSHFRDNSAVGGPMPSSRYRPQNTFMSSPPQSHFHNAAAGAPAVPATSPPQMNPPPFARDDFKFAMNIPPPQPPFGHSQMVPGNSNMNDGGYRQPPPPQQTQFTPSSIMRPTSIPNPGLFAIEPNNGFKVEAPPSFIPNQAPSVRQDFQGSFGGGSQGSFGPQQPVFMNPNVPPPPLPNLPSSSSRHSHSGW